MTTSYNSGSSSDARAMRAAEIVESMPAFAWSADPNGRFTYVSRNALAYHGAAQTDLDPVPGGDEFGWRRIVHPDDYERTASRWRHCLRTGDHYDSEHRLRRADGAYRWFRNSGRASRDDQGAITQWYGTTLDIDDQIQTETRLRERELELSQLVDMVPSHIWRLTPAGEPIFFNKRMVDFLGLDVADVDKPGMTRLEAIIATVIHPSEAAAFAGVLRRCLTSGDRFSMRYRLRRFDGVYHWMSSSAEPMRDEEGSIVQWYGLCHDIDDQMHAEEALRDREREFSQLVNMVPSHIWRLSPDGEPIFFNKRMVDFLHMEVADTDRPGMSRLQTVVETVHPDDVSLFKETLHHSLAIGQSFALQYRLRRADGNYRWMSGRAEPMRDGSGSIVQWFGLSHDIDDQMRLYSEIAEREAKIRRLVDSDIIGIVIWDLDGTLIDANDAFLDMIQYKREDVKDGIRWFDMTPPEWQEIHAHEEAEELAATGKMQPREKEYFRKDGSRVPVLIGAACFEGQSRQGVAFILDLTERKRAEAALRDQERELSQLVDMVPSYLWRITPDGVPVFFNKRLVDFLGFDVTDADEPDRSSFAAIVEAVVHPDDSARVTDAFARAFASGEPLSMRWRMRRADGVYRWMAASAEALRVHDGRIAQWYGLCHDIDDQVLAEEALRESERSLRELVETLPVMIDCAAPNGEPIFRSRRLREFLGYDLEDLAGVKSRLDATLAAGVHPDDLTGVKENYAHSLVTGEPYARRHRLRRFDGEYRWVETRAAPMRNADGIIIQWNVICLDIDGEVRAEEQLRLSQERLARANQAASLAELSASIAHEVNQPLAAIVANSHACQRWLSAKPPNVGRAKVTAERITRDANSAADVVSRIRALFRQTPDPKSPEDINRVISEVYQLMADEIAAKDIRIETDIEQDLPLVALDRVQMQQVFVNLIRNGVQAMDAVADGARSLRIRSCRDGLTAIRVEICDAGTGFKDVERVFEPFFTTKPNGMGMGLAICRSIVELHRGRLWIANNETRGATVAFTLPVATSMAS